MKTYTAEFRTQAEHGSCGIKAKSPKQALQLARKLYHAEIPARSAWCNR